MNSLTVCLGMLVFLIAGYRIYGKLIEDKVVKPDPKAKTPAHALRDNIDYCPAPKSFLFGHHFASIAGAAPIIGPLIAVAHFGWLAAAGWIALGSVFIGAVHDYLALMISVRNQGASIAEIAEKVMSKRAKLTFSIFLYLALVLIVAVFGIVGAKTLVKQPEIVIPTFAVILIAMGLGWLVYKLKMPTVPATIVGLSLLFLSIYLGYLHPVILPAMITAHVSATSFWFIALIIYSLLASVMPVWFLLQPRDYLSVFLLLIGMLLGYIGIAVAHKPMLAPAFITFDSPAQGTLWPMLFILIACGAISGFHSLVAGGTTSKQLNNESEGKLIGYGGMIMEAGLAALALIVVSAGLPWEVPMGADDSFVFKKLLAEKGWIIAFGAGYGRIVDHIPGITYTMALLFAILTLKTFVITSLDTATRLGRFIIVESLGAAFPIFKNRWLTALMVVIPAFIVGITNGYQAIWPIFGATNQLIAALTLIIISAYLLGIKRPAVYTIVPAALMLVTTIAALIYKTYTYLTADEPKVALGIVGIVLIVLALFLVSEAWGTLRKTHRSKRKRA